MSANEAVIRNAAAAPPLSGPPTYTPNATQVILRDELSQRYGIDKSQITFTGPANDPIFDFDALSVLVNELSDFSSTIVDIGTVDHERGFCTATGTITLADGRTRSNFGSAFVGEMLHDETTVKDMQSAMELARARALRSALRSASFDPVRAHRNRHSGLPVSTPSVPSTPDDPSTSTDTPEDPRRAMERECHAIGEHIGLITKSPHYDSVGNKRQWRWLMKTFFGKETMAELTDLEQTQWRNTLRGLQNQFDGAQTKPRTDH